MSILQKAKESCAWQIKAKIARLKRVGIVLMYHRVNDGDFDPFHLNVSPKNFDEQMQVIKKYAKPLKMKAMSESLTRHNLLNDKIAVTFDDGFADNYHYAKPILEKHDVPATFYIPSHAIETSQEFWWDALSKILIAPELPEIFEMTINGTPLRWKIDSNSTNQSNLMDLLPSTDSTVSKKQLFLFTWRMIRPLSFDLQQDLVRKILLWANIPSSWGVPYLPMTVNELVDMSKFKLFEIGAHTVHHPLLSAWTNQEQKKEILEGKEKVESWINKPITSFAYPFGDYSKDTPAILKELNFLNACTVIEKPVWRHSDPFLMPRFMVMNWNGKKFGQKLQEWLTLRI